jgi:quinol monooxygenase YgiN
MLRQISLSVPFALTMFAGAATAQDTAPVVAIISHPVADYAAWREIYDQALPLREAAGMTRAQVLQSPDDPNMIILIQEFESLEGAQALFASPEVKAAMKDAGVAAPPSITIGVPAE